MALICRARFSACWGLGFTLGCGPAGIWIRLSISLTIYAILLIRRFHSLTRRDYLPDLATAR